MSGAHVMVTGTDTGVGKTFVAAGLARLWSDRGENVGVIKPIETGHDVGVNGPWPQDARTLAIAARSAEACDAIVPYVFREPLAPLVAARREGRVIEPERLVDAFRRIEARHDRVIVEGAGGLSVPLAEFGENDGLYDHVDLAKLIGLPLLVVARAHLGTLNHTFLTVRYARDRGVEVVGVVLNGRDVRIDDPSVEDNAALIEEMCACPVLGTIDFHEGPVDVETMATACAAALDLERLDASLTVTGDPR